MMAYCGLIPSFLIKLSFMVGALIPNSEVDIFLKLTDKIGKAVEARIKQRVNLKKRKTSEFLMVHNFRRMMREEASTRGSRPISSTCSWTRRLTNFLTKAAKNILELTFRFDHFKGFGECDNFRFPKA